MLQHFMLNTLVLSCFSTAVIAQQHSAIEIPMRDGKKLAADLYLPKQASKSPCVLIQTPYNRKRMRRAFVAGSAEAADPRKARRGGMANLRAFLDRGRYAYVIVDWRGFFESKAAMRGVNRRQWRRGLDGYDCVEWIAKQPWCNGKIGTWGGSALGKQQLVTAVEHPPHLVCAVPMICSQGQLYESFYEGGVPLAAHLARLDQLGFGMSRLVLRYPDPNAWTWHRARERSYRPDQIQVPVLFISGWWDNYPDLVLQTFRDIVAQGGEKARQHSKIMMGPWDHSSLGQRRVGDLEFPGAELASAKAAKAFLDRWLLEDVDEAQDPAQEPDQDQAPHTSRPREETPRYRWFDSGSRKWHSAEDFPEQGAHQTVWQLRGDGLLGPTPSNDRSQGAPVLPSAPAPASKILRYSHDPLRPTPTLGGANLPPLPHGPKKQNALLERDDLLVWRSGPLKAKTEILGRVRVLLHFRIDQKDADFCVRLCDVHPDGSAYLLGDRAQRLRLRAPQNAPRTEAPANEADRFDRVQLDFTPLHHTLQPGHELMLIVASSNAPRYERNPHTGATRWDPQTAVPLEVEIRCDPQQPSTISW
jgi:putative CocE/NonD family hydrolase